MVYFLSFLLFFLSLLNVTHNENTNNEFASEIYIPPTKIGLGCKSNPLFLTKLFPIITDVAKMNLVSYNVKKKTPSVYSAQYSKHLSPVFQKQSIVTFFTEHPLSILNSKTYLKTSYYLSYKINILEDGRSSVSFPPPKCYPYTCKGLVRPHIRYAFHFFLCVGGGFHTHSPINTHRLINSPSLTNTS